MPPGYGGPSEVHGVPSREVRIMVLRLFFAAASSASLRGAPTGIVTFTGRRPQVACSWIAGVG